MNCKNCQCELEEGVTLCPECGTENAEPQDAAENQEAIVVEPAAEAEEPKETAKPGLSAGKIALLVALAVAAVAVVIALIVGGMDGKEPAETTAPNGTVEATIPADGNPDDATCKGSYTVTDEVMKAEAATVVATMGDAKLTNGQLQVYYWMQVYDFLDQYASYAAMFGMDYTKPLDTQMSIEGTLTWQQYFLDSAVDTWRNYQAMCFAAENAGYVLDQEYSDYLAQLPASLAESAKTMGYESAEAMVQGDMGVGATLEDYMSYLEHYYLGYMYYGDTLEAMEITDADLEAFFNEHAEEYAENGLTKEDYSVDVRHILLQPQGGTEGEDGTTTYSDAEWEACRQAANEVLNTWLSGAQTEEAFSELAKTHSTDPGSQTAGGLYEDVVKGQMVEPFENWCFDAARKTGDYGIVETSYGCHVMYFVRSELLWPVTAREDMLVEKGNEFLKGILAQYPADVNFSAIALGNVSLASEQ